jgi:hypothetical protein
MAHESIPSSFKELKEMYESSADKFGITTFHHPHGLPLVMVTENGQWLLEKHPELFGMLTRGYMREWWQPGLERFIGKAQRGFVVKDRVNGLNVARKHIKQKPDELNGFEQIKALNLLKRMGIPTAEGIVATAAMLVREWVPDPVHKADDPQFQKYMARFYEIYNKHDDEKRAAATTPWKIDDDPTNFVVGNWGHNDPLHHFRVFDPVY